MSSKIKLLEAAILHEKSKALAAIASAEALLDNIGSNPSQDNLDALVSYASEIVKHEHAMNALQVYFAKTPQPAAPQKPAPVATKFVAPTVPQPKPDTSSGDVKIGHDELMKRSQTYRKSMERVSPDDQKPKHVETYKKSLKGKFDEPK